MYLISHTLFVGFFYDNLVVIESCSNFFLDNSGCVGGSISWKSSYWRGNWREIFGGCRDSSVEMSY